jgi:hypothetical protein
MLPTKYYFAVAVTVAAILPTSMPKAAQAQFISPYVPKPEQIRPDIYKKQDDGTVFDTTTGNVYRKRKLIRRGNGSINNTPSYTPRRAPNSSPSVTVNYTPEQIQRGVPCVDLPRRLEAGGIRLTPQQLSAILASFGCQANSPDQSQSNEEFIGVGIRLREDKTRQLLAVDSIINGGSAASAGILPNDILTSIDRLSTNGMAVEQAAKLIRGSIGSEVTLTVLRNDQPLKFRLKRSRFVVPKQP